MEPIEIIALGSVLLNALLGVATYRLNKRKQELEEEARQSAQVDRERNAAILASANVVPVLEKLRNRVGVRLTLENTGSHEATDVHVHITGLRAGGERIGLNVKGFPLLRLQPHQRHKVHISAAPNVGPPYELNIEWTDGQGKQSKSHSLTPSLAAD